MGTHRLVFKLSFPLCLHQHTVAPVYASSSTNSLMQHHPSTVRHTQTHKSPQRVPLCTLKCACSQKQTRPSEPHTQTLKPKPLTPAFHLPPLAMRVEKGWEGRRLAQPLFPPSARWLAPTPSHLAESASTALLQQPWLFWANSLRVGLC